MKVVVFSLKSEKKYALVEWTFFSTRKCKTLTQTARSFEFNMLKNNKTIQFTFVFHFFLFAIPTSFFFCLVMFVKPRGAEIFAAVFRITYFVCSEAKIFPRVSNKLEILFLVSICFYTKSVQNYSELSFSAI
jgi:hypothetical protein